MKTLLFLFISLWIGVMPMLAQDSPQQAKQRPLPPPDYQQQQKDDPLQIKELVRDHRGKKGDTRIQVAILLDTSNSMDGLIDQAKSQLWKMVNELSLAQDHWGNIPRFELALYEYGNDRLSERKGYIRQVSPLSTDLDVISEKLFSLKTDGGDEFCGQVIQKATNELQWGSGNYDLKLMFIAGNERFTQGPVEFKDACIKAKEGDIIVNTIFCGDFNEGVETKWKQGAMFGDGKYMNIDQNEKMVYINAPQDKELERLNEDINDTYIGYGREGSKRKEMQRTQDYNASSYGRANTAQRAMSKASSSYSNANWDLIDATKDKTVDLDEVAEKDLPDEMKKMSMKERKEYVQRLSRKRTKIKERIQQLNKERRSYVAAERQKMSDKGTLDEVMLTTIREQAEAKGFQFEE